jgi:hypothetical protein
MSNHDQFEQLCALAAAGEIGLSDRQVLKAHLETCASCRSVFADMEEIHAELLPEHPGCEIATDPQSDLRLRTAILKRATKEGARFSRHAQRLPQSSGEQAFMPRSPRQWMLAATAVVVLCVGVAATLYHLRPQPVLDGAPAARAEMAGGRHATEPANVDARPSTPSGEAQRALERAIADSRAEQARLQGQLDDQERQAAVLQHDSADAARMIADLEQQLEAARTSQRQAEVELASLRSARATNEAITIAQQQEVQRLTDRLMEQTASLERERHLLSAGREIRDLIAARNLRIIDVYDTDSRGKTSRAFGRVFYTEGKSLVFYAYDLKERQPNSGNYAFFVWGKRDGAPQDIKSLGALAKDDQVQKRWVFTITDPKVLADIDSVFVTLETTDRPGKRPSGKRLLSAFLHTPINHP